MAVTCALGAHSMSSLPLRFRKAAVSFLETKECDLSCCSRPLTYRPTIRLTHRGRHGHITKNFLQELELDLNCAVLDDHLNVQETLGNTTCTLAVLDEHLHMQETLGNTTCTLAVLASQDIEESEKLDDVDKDVLPLGLLPSLQVQSLEEQNVLASTPAHQEGLYALYANFFVGGMVEQIWQGAWPVAVALLHNSLLPVAVISFVSKAVIFIGGPWVGAFLDHMPRVSAINTLGIVQSAAQAVAAGTIIYAFRSGVTASASSNALLSQPWFFVLGLAASIESLTGMAAGIAFERDWVILLVGANRPIALANANATLSRIHLICEIAGASCVGALLYKFNLAKCLLITLIAAIGSLPITMLLAHCTDKLSTGVLERSKLRNTDSLEATGVISWDLLKLGWSQYLMQPTLPVSLAAVFLFFNIGLAPGNLMISFLTQKGLNPTLIGVFNSMGAVMGFAATFLSAMLIRKFGMLKAGAVGLIYHASILSLALAVFWSNSWTQSRSQIMFLGLIVLSRLGSCTYELVGSQIIQTAVPPSRANMVGITELSLASLAELIMLGVVFIVKEASHWGYLALLSMAAVVGAAFLYYRWMTNLGEEQSRQLSIFSLSE